jgi:hypothetical protein
LKGSVRPKKKRIKSVEVIINAAKSRMKKNADAKK